MNLTVVSFWTGQPWQDHATQLAVDCENVGLKVAISRREDLGSWVANCNQKPAFIRDMLQDLNDPILWIDADARINEPPVLLKDPKEEFAVHAFPGGKTFKPVGREEMSLPEGWPLDELGSKWFNSGTVYFRPTPKVFDLLDLWCQFAATRMTSDWDQWLLQEAWTKMRPETLWLPETYCRWRKGRADDNPVIQHLLASVKIRGLDRG